MQSSYIYRLVSKKNGTLYIGVTADLIRRIWEHKNDLADGFTKKHNVKILVYYEIFNHIEYAIEREKQLKGWLRKKKLALFEKQNPEWDDLYETLV